VSPATFGTPFDQLHGVKAPLPEDRLGEGCTPSALLREHDLASLVLFAGFCSRCSFHLGMSHFATEDYGPLRIAPVLSVNEAARVLGVERSTIYRLLRAGELQAIRVGRRRKFRPEDLDSYLERNRETVAGP